MKLYSVHIDIDSNDPYFYTATRKEADKIRAEQPIEYGEIDKLETSPNMTPLEVVLSILNETGWIAKRTMIVEDKK